METAAGAGCGPSAHSAVGRGTAAAIMGRSGSALHNNQETVVQVGCSAAGPGHAAAGVEGACNGGGEVVPKSLRDEVLRAMHGAAGSGHFGVTKTLCRLCQSFYWGRCRRDIEDFCRRCDPCTARKGPSGRSHASLQQFPVGALMERVAVDAVGPLPRSTKGNCYVLSASDYFSRWPEAYALPDQEAETVLDALLEGMFSHFGVPVTIHSDQGRNFESRVFASMCEHLGAHTRPAPLPCGLRVMG